MDLGSKNKKRPKCLQNKGKPNKTTIALITLIGHTFHPKSRKKRQRNKWFHFRARPQDCPHPQPPCGTPLLSFPRVHTMGVKMFLRRVLRRTLSLAGLETQTQNAAFLECKRPKRKPWHRGRSLMGERQSIAQKGVRATDLRNSQP